eukprot:TRINITY_DN1451_c0_g1_i2.p1 TRINITY_DN1451_c0_g1~~TRINITY_DN1451_c0_g1_i2.p1  ORF type:complete len:935 (+),score=355.13 TRINITY_DN1451_c0_g1_i2:355-2805(+)
MSSLTDEKLLLETKVEELKLKIDFTRRKERLDELKEEIALRHKVEGVLQEQVKELKQTVEFWNQRFQHEKTTCHQAKVESQNLRQKVISMQVLISDLQTDLQKAKETSMMAGGRGRGLVVAGRGRGRGSRTVSTGLVSSASIGRGRGRGVTIDNDRQPQEEGEGETTTIASIREEPRAEAVEDAVEEPKKDEKDETEQKTEQKTAVTTEESMEPETELILESASTTTSVDDKLQELQKEVDTLSKKEANTDDTALLNFNKRLAVSGVAVARKGKGDLDKRRSMSVAQSGRSASTPSLDVVSLSSSSFSSSSSSSSLVGTPAPLRGKSRFKNAVRLIRERSDSIGGEKKQVRSNAEAEKAWNDTLKKVRSEVTNVQYRSHEEIVEESAIELPLLKELPLDENFGGTHIWVEPERDSQGNLMELIVVDDEIQLGSINRLVEVVTTPGRKAEIEGMVLSYGTMMSAPLFLLKLLQRFDVPAGNDKAKDLIQRSVFNVLLMWIKMHPDDFSTDGMLASHLRLFCNTTLRPEGHQDWADELVSYLDGEKKRTLDANLELAPMPDIPKNVFLPSLSWKDVSAQELARQITVMDWHAFGMVRANEFYRLAWSKDRLKHLSPNLLSTIDRFNGLSMFVITQVLSVEDKKDRAKVMGQFIQIGECLKELNNYNGMGAINAGLNHMAIHRLNQTKKELKKRDEGTLDLMNQIMNPEGSYKGLRAVIKDAIANGEPVVPYMGVFCTDLTFIEDGNSDEKDGLINFKKRMMISQVISQVKQCQKRPFDLIEVPQISRFFGTEKLRETMMGEDEAYERSQVLEERSGKK